MKQAQGKRSATDRILTYGVLIGVLLTFLSIGVTRKTQFFECRFTATEVHTVSRGAPIAYVTVTPHEKALPSAVCDPVDNLSALWAPGAIVHTNFVSMLADAVFWSALGVAAMAAVRKLNKKSS